MKAINKIGLIFISLTLVISCQPEANKADAVLEAEEVKVFPVRVEKVQKKSIIRTLDYTANLTAYKEIHYAPASPGRIDNINVEVGSRVKKGQILVETDKTQLAAAKTQLASAKDSYDRIKTLYDQGSMAEQQYEQTKTQYELAQQNVDYLIENTTLKSPINGIVTGKYYETGEMFSGAPNTQAGKAAIISLMQINPLKAVVNISQTYYDNVKVGMQAKITTDILPGKVFDGKVTKVFPTIDPMTRTFMTEIVVSNKDEKLRPGMFTNIEMYLEEDEALMLPAISILKQDGINNKFVFVYENGRARKINLTLNKRVDDQVEVISNELTEGMDLIIEGQSKLIDGSSIELVK